MIFAKLIEILCSAIQDLFEIEIPLSLLGVLLGRIRDLSGICVIEADLALKQVILDRHFCEIL